MRKKSHISLARFLVRDTDDEELKKHRLAFYIGSILPDCKPSFIYKKHEIGGTFEDVKKAITKLSYGRQNKPAKRGSGYYRNLGQVTHYLADYFTYPHNKIYPGNFKDHCVYEEDLKLGLRKYLKEDRELGMKLLEKQKEQRKELKDPEAVFNFIQNTHQDYLKKKINIEEDMKNIVAVNHLVVKAIGDIFHHHQNGVHSS